MSMRHGMAVIAAQAVLLVGCGGRELASSPDANAFADASAGYDSSPCGDTQTDPHHCGTCGHDCLGGSCSAGACQPVVLATVTAPSSITSFAVDASDVYWTWTAPSLVGGVSKCAVTGCNSNPVTLAKYQSVPGSIYVAGTSLYWGNYNSAAIMRCSTDCNDDAVVFLQWPKIEAGVGYVASANSVFVTSGAWGTDAVFECPASGCPNPVTLVTGQHAPTQIVTDGASLYWLDFGVQIGGKVVQWVDGGVAKSDISGANPTTLATGYASPTGLAVDATNVYWAVQDSVLACSVMGCGGSPATVISVPNDNLWGVAVDQTDVYFGASDASQAWRIMKCPLPSGGACTTPTALTGNQYDQFPLEELAVDSKRIYWVSNDRTQIFVLAK